MKVAVGLVLMCLLGAALSASIGVKVSEHASQGGEDVMVLVKRAEAVMAEDGSLAEERVVSVNLGVHVAKGAMLINGQVAPLGEEFVVSVVAKVTELHARSEEVLSVRPAAVKVAGLVHVEERPDGARLLRLREHITEIEGNAVMEIFVQGLEVTMDVNGNEMSRSLFRVDVGEKAAEPSVSLPETPLHASQPAHAGEQPHHNAHPNEKCSQWDRIKGHFVRFGERFVAGVKELWARKPWGRVELIAIGVGLAGLLALAVYSVCRCCCCRAKVAGAKPLQRKVYLDNIKVAYTRLPTQAPTTTLNKNKPAKK